MSQIAELASRQEADFDRSVLADPSAAHLSLLKEMGYVDG